MRFKVVFLTLFLTVNGMVVGQDSNQPKMKDLSCAEKWWVLWHPFKAKKAKIITAHVRHITDSIRENNVLPGKGNGDQVDAFRHAYWLARLTQEIGWRSAQKLGKAHEKGNYRQYKKGKLEDGRLPDRMSSKMDLYNNFMGMIVGLSREEQHLVEEIILLTDQGHFKMIKRNASGEFLDENDAIIPEEELKGKWENRKCLVPTNWVFAESTEG